MYQIPIQFCTFFVKIGYKPCTIAVQSLHKSSKKTVYLPICTYHSGECGCLRILSASISNASTDAAAAAATYRISSTARSPYAGAAADASTNKAGWAAFAATVTVITSAILAPASRISAAATAAEDIFTASTCTPLAATAVTAYAYDTAITTACTHSAAPDVTGYLHDPQTAINIGLRLLRQRLLVLQLLLASAAGSAATWTASTASAAAAAGTATALAAASTASTASAAAAG